MKCNNCGKKAGLYFTEYGQNNRVSLCRSCATGKARFGTSEDITTVDRRERPETEKVAEELTELHAYMAKRQETLNSWRSWFALGGEEDKASPVSGREIIGYCKTDIARAKKRIEKLS